MNKDDIKSQYDALCADLNLTFTDVIVSGGAACVLFGIKQEANDLDVIVNKSTYNSLVSSGKYIIVSKNGIQFIKYNDVIEIFAEFNNINNSIVLINDICCYSPYSIYKIKQKLNRAKDQEDICLLSKFYSGI